MAMWEGVCLSASCSEQDHWGCGVLYQVILFGLVSFICVLSFSEE